MEGKQVVIVQDKLRKIVHNEGEGDLPKKGQEVFATYKGTLQNGTVFDSNLDRSNPFSFVLGQGQVIKGWDQGFASMKKGQKATLICSPEYAYGASGSPPSIPPNSTLNFEVELVDFKDKKKQKWEYSDQQKFTQASSLKQRGNQKLKASDYKGAVDDYKEGIEFIENESSNESKQLLNVLRLNTSQAYLKLNKFGDVITECTKVLKQQSGNVKALYRRGVAYSKNQDYELAKADFNQLLKHDPQNLQAKKQLVQISAAIKAFEKKQKKLFGQIFSKGVLYDDVKSKASVEEQPKPQLEVEQNTQAKTQ